MFASSENALCGKHMSRAKALAEGGERMVKINGTEMDVSGKTVAEYLATTDYHAMRIAVERNGEIVPKARYAETVLQDGDSVEIVNFVGGG